MEVEVVIKGFVAYYTYLGIFPPPQTTTTNHHHCRHLKIRAPLAHTGAIINMLSLPPSLLPLSSKCVRDKR